MFANHFYNESTRRMVSVFGSIFNDLQVVKKDAAGKILQKIQVPLGYGLTFNNKKMNWNIQSETQKKLGVTAVSAGNHAIATSYAAKRFKLKNKIFIYNNANKFRVNKCEELYSLKAD